MKSKVNPDLCSAFTGSEDLRVVEIEEPTPASDEILIDVHAASVSFMDHLMVSGRYQMRPPTPFVPGTEGAGVVVAVGSGITRFRPGDRVACGSWTGGYAERMVAKEWQSVRLPANVDFETAATVWHNYGTAYYALVDRARVRSGETAFVTGAAGGVGLATVDLARHLGLRVIAGVGSDDKANIVRNYGAFEVINYRTEDLRERIKSATGGEGVDVCFENVGGAIFEQMARLMKWGGRLMPIVFTSGQIPPFRAPKAKHGRVRVSATLRQWDCVAPTFSSPSLWGSPSAQSPSRSPSPQPEDHMPSASSTRIVHRRQSSAPAAWQYRAKCPYARAPRH